MAEADGGAWTKYFDAMAGMPARETLLAALRGFEEDGTHRRGAESAERELEGKELLGVDLGCGEGRDTVELLRRGWRVVAVDSEREAIDRLLARVPEEERGRLSWVIERFERAEWPRCDLVNASFSIPHCEPRDFPGVWAKIVASMGPGGRFAGQFFGVNDSWARKPDGVVRTYHTRRDVEGMLAGFEVEMLDEVEREGKNAFGEPKYWHVFHVVARKKS